MAAAFVLEDDCFLTDEATLKALACPICLGTVQDAVYICSNAEHVVCRSCFDQARAFACPLCQQPSMQEPHAASQSRRFVEALRYRCHNHDRGCNWIGSVDSIRGHLASEVRDNKVSTDAPKCVNGSSRQTKAVSRRSRDKERIAVLHETLKQTQTQLGQAVAELARARGDLARARSDAAKAHTDHLRRFEEVEMQHIASLQTVKQQLASNVVIWENAERDYIARLDAAETRVAIEWSGREAEAGAARDLALLLGSERQARTELAASHRRLAAVMRADEMQHARAIEELKEERQARKQLADTQAKLEFAIARERADRARLNQELSSERRALLQVRTELGRLRVELMASRGVRVPARYL